MADHRLYSPAAAGLPLAGLALLALAAGCPGPQLLDTQPEGTASDTDVATDVDTASDTDPRPPLQWKAMEAGQLFSCGLTLEGEIRCFGIPVSPVTDSPAGTGYKEISAGPNAACAVDENDLPICWGGDADVQAAPAVAVRGISVGSLEACAIRLANDVPICWGYVPSQYRSLTTDTPADVISLYAGVLCAMHDGHVRCAGIPAYDPTNPPGYDPWSEQPDPTLEFIAISSGYVGACGILRTGQIHCWGAPFGIIKPEFLAMSPLGGGFIDISLANWSACALHSQYGAICWRRDSPSFANVPRGLTEISHKAHHTCGLRSDHTAACWGLDQYGETNVPRF